MQMSPMAPSPLAAPTSNQNPPSSSSAMRSPATPLQSLSLGLQSLPPSTSSAAAAAGSHRQMPSDHHTVGTEPVVAGHQVLESTSAAGAIARIRLSDIVPYEGAPCSAYVRAVEALSGSLTRHNAVVIELGSEEAALMRCAFESSRLYFRKTLILLFSSFDLSQPLTLLGLFLSFECTNRFSSDACEAGTVVLPLQESLEHDRRKITSAMMKNYPQLLRKFLADKAKVSSLVEMMVHLKLELYSLKRKEQNFRTVVQLRKDAFFEHGEKDTLRSCIKALMFCSIESQGELQEFVQSKLKELENVLMVKLKFAIKEAEVGDEEYPLHVNIKRLYELQLATCVSNERESVKVWQLSCVISKTLMMRFWVFCF